MATKQRIIVITLARRENQGGEDGERTGSQVPSWPWNSSVALKKSYGPGCAADKPSRWVCDGGVNLNPEAAKAEALAHTAVPEKWAKTKIR